MKERKRIEQSLAGDAKGRRGKLVAKCQAQWPLPLPPLKRGVVPRENVQ